MRNNKILAAAIASALSLGVGSAFAELKLAAPLPPDNTGNLNIPVFATQLFPGDINIASPIGGTAFTASDCGDFTALNNTATFLIRYKIPHTVKVEPNTIYKVTATLSGSAGWAGAAGAPLVGAVDPVAQAMFCTSISASGAPVNADCTGGTLGTASLAQITKISPTADRGLSTVDFAIQTTTSINMASAYLFFCPSIDADFLKDQGSSLSLTMTTSETTASGGVVPSSAGTETVVIASSAPGVNVIMDDGATLTTETLPAQAAISFIADSLKFSTGASISSMTDTDRVSLGRVLIDNIPGVVDRDGSGDYNLALAIGGWSGKLTIIDGPFSASTGANQVFLDDNEKCVYDTTSVTEPSIPANTVTSTTAEWSLSSEQLGFIYDNVSGEGMHVCVIADGVKTIEQQTNAPTAVLEMGASASTFAKYGPGRLRHLKENGTKCTLYNVPDGTESGTALSTDVVSVRITNNSPAVGKLYATLYDQSGKAIYTPQKRVPIGEIQPFQTIRYYTGQENSPGYESAKDLATFGGAQHWVGQRATLIIASDLPKEDISIFGLVRNRNSGPNMNMSTGATGNGCD